MSNTTDRGVQVSCYAIDRYIDENIVQPTETPLRGKDVISWGEGNSYPEYLLELYNSVPTLRSIINGSVDYIVGDDVITTHTLNGDAMNRKGDSIRDIVRKIAFDKEVYGGFALQIIRSKDGSNIAEINYVDMRYLRTNKEQDVFYYSEEWSKKWGRTSKALIYPKFKADTKGENPAPSSILFIKDNHTQVYPSPVYAASVKACEIERCIDDFHLNAINNGFVSSYIVNFNNGEPTAEIKNEIEKNFNEKFSGHQNAGRIVYSWNRSQDTKTTIEKVDVEDFGEKYQSLAKHSRQQIFTAFRANPNLFGIPTESLGFSSEEYDSAFNLFNRTMIQPVQDMIVDAFDKIFGEKDSIQIIPFSSNTISKEE